MQQLGEPRISADGVEHLVAEDRRHDPVAFLDGAIEALEGRVDLSDAEVDVAEGGREVVAAGALEPSERLALLGLPSTDAEGEATQTVRDGRRDASFRSLVS